MRTFICPDIKVKPCPCCGKESLLWTSSADVESSDGEFPVLFWVQCSNEECGVRTLDSASYQDAIETWDRRPDRPKPAPDNSASTRMMQVSYEAFQLFNRKNADYGNSFSRCGIGGVMVRLMDKISRAIVVSRHSIQVQSETLRDTLLDLSNYALMGVILLDTGKTPSHGSCSPSHRTMEKN